MIEVTPHPVQFWSGVPVEFVTSKRKYATVRRIRGEVEDNDYGYRRDSAADLTLYLDPETGLVVWDVGAYEKYMGGE